MTAPFRTQADALPRTRGGIGYVERAGGGETIVFLHGIGSNANGFATLFDHLPEGLRLIAWNAPGYCGSTPLTVDWPTAAEYADALALFLNDLDLDCCILVGHSLGTLMGAAFAKAYPDRISHLILAASAQGYGIPVGDPLPDKAAKRITDLTRQGPAAFAKARAANLVHAPETAPEIVAEVEANMAQIDPSGYAQAVRMLANGNLSALMAQVTAPTGFITGVQDAVTPRAQADAAAQAWAEANKAAPQMIHVKEAGHAIYVQQPEAFAGALKHLLPQIGAS